MIFIYDKKGSSFWSIQFQDKKKKKKRAKSAREKKSNDVLLCGEIIHALNEMDFDFIDRL